MSMLTRCPECGTSFRITTDQLVSRQGKVRCGRCQHVFSALASLVHTRDSTHPSSDQVAPLDGNPPPQGAAPAPAARNDTLPANLRALAGAQGPSSRFPGLESDSNVLGPMTNSHLTPLGTASRPLNTSGPPSYEEIEISGGAAGSPSGLHTDSHLSVPGEGPPIARPLRELERAGEEDEDEEEEQGRRRIAWLSLVGVLLALLLLAGQGAYFYRDQLALWQPETKPWLLMMCEKLKCQIKIPLDPQAISIDSSTLEADPADRNLLQLTALLRNRSVLPQNLPYLELTLLDAQDAPQSRRVIPPAEYGVRPDGTIPSQLAADGELQVRLAIDSSQLKANGYRLYAFYP